MAEPNGDAAEGLTPSQTVGPFLHIILADPDEAYAAPLGMSGGFWLRGRVCDGNGDPVIDALVETWQADPAGRFDHPDDPRGPIAAPDPAFRGFGRCPTNSAGQWAIFTVKPASVPASDGRTEAPHLAMSVFARGLLDRVVTRVYFADEIEANAADPVLGTVSEARRPTLLAAPAADGYRFDVHLQGAHETVFFDL